MSGYPLQISAISLEFECRVYNELNHHGHWRARAARVREVRERFHVAWFEAGRPTLSPAVWSRVQFVRRSARPFDDDGLVASFKSVRDELCLRVFRSKSDSLPLVEWPKPTWEKGPGHTVLVHITQDPTDPNAPRPRPALPVGELTPRQHIILTNIRDHIEDHGYPPTLAELCLRLGLVSTNGVSESLDRLEKKRRILWPRHPVSGRRITRGIQIL